MMKRLWLMGAVLGMTAMGCQQNAKQATTQEDLSDARRDAAKAEADTRREAAEKKAEIDAKAQKDIADEQREVAKAQEDLAKSEGTGGSGTAGEQQLATGILKSSMGNGLTVTEKSGGELELATDDSTQVTLNGSPVKLDEFRQGTPLRVSYQTQGNKKIAKNVMVLAPTRKK